MNDIATTPVLLGVQLKDRSMTDSMHVILIVEDDSALQQVLTVLFEANRFRVLVGGTASEAIQAARQHKPDLVLLDLGLPDRDGLDVIESIRSWSAVPIVVLTARAEEVPRLTAFERGADDYVLKPFSSPELLARVRAVLRRRVGGDQPMAILRLGAVEIDMGNRLARSLEGKEIHLTPTEYRVLEVLTRNANRVVTLSALLKEVWGRHRDDVRGLRVHIGSLRKKLEADPEKPKHILTELNLGYRLIIESKDSADS